MDGFSLSFLILATSSLLTLVNPIGIAPLYLGLTESYSPEKRIQAINRGTATALIVMLLFALMGNLIFKFFGITIHAFRIAGGLLFFRIGLDMMQARMSRTKSSHSEHTEAMLKEDIGITPLGVPIIGGPGAITSVMILSGETQTVFALGLVIIAIIITLSATYVILRTAPKISLILGDSGVRIITRIMGLIVMVISVQFIIDGIRPILTEIIRTAIQN